MAELKTVLSTGHKAWISSRGFLSIGLEGPYDGVESIELMLPFKDIEALCDLVGTSRLPPKADREKKAILRELESKED